MIYQRRLNEFSSEIVYLKDVVNEQQLKISTYQKNAVSSGYNMADSAAADTGSAARINDSSVTVDSDRAAKTASAHDGPSYSALGRRDTTEKFMSNSVDNKPLKGDGFGSRITMQEDSGGMDGKYQDEDEVALNEEASQSVKRRKTEPSDDIKASLGASMDTDQADHQYWRVEDSNAQVPPGAGNGVMKSPRSEVSAVAQHVNPAMEALEQGMEDDRCPVCLDCPFGLMVLCSGCRNALHSACAKKTGGGATGVRAVNCIFPAVIAVYTQ